MNLRIICSVMVAIMFTGMAQAQQPIPSMDAEKSQPPENTIDVMSPPAFSEGPAHDAFSIDRSFSQPFLWASADYTMSWLSRQNLPALVTSSSAGVPQAEAGVPGLSTTKVLLGLGPVDSAFANGVRLTTGISFQDGMSFELSGFFMQNRVVNDDFGSTGGPGTSAVARPFFDPNTLQDTAALVGFPNRFAGNIDINMHSSLWGIKGDVFEEWNLGIPLATGVGFRYANLHDNLQIQQDTTALGAPALTFNGAAIPLSDSTRIIDSFQTQNQFIGPELGIRTQRCFGAFSVEVLGEVALGNTEQTLSIAGQTSHVSHGGQILQTVSGGFLASGANMGSTSHNAFSAIPEFNLKLGYKVTNYLNLFVSYDLLYWTDVLRAGSQVDPLVNPTHVPTAAIFSPTPAAGNFSPAFQGSDLLVHSIRVGLELKY
jgi:hypothetical protein